MPAPPWAPSSPYGPGKPKSPVYGEGLPLASKAHASPAPTFAIKAAASFKLAWHYDWGYAPASERPEYMKVAEALGFTRAEIAALVGCNDAGVTFADIADLIESHPVVYSSAMTPNRVAEESDFVARCEALKRQRAAANDPPWGFSVDSAALAMYGNESHLTMLKFSTKFFTGLPTDSLLAWALGVAIKPSPLWTPSATKGAKLAAALGIWVPPKQDAPKFGWSL